MLLTHLVFFQFFDGASEVGGGGAGTKKFFRSLIGVGF